MALDKAKWSCRITGWLCPAVVLWSGTGSALASTPTLSAADMGDLEIPMWNTAFDVRGGMGYKDNITLSGAEGAQDSAFWHSQAEVMIFRLPSHGWQFNFLASAEDVRYFGAPSVSDEQVAMAVAQLNKDFGAGWKSTLGFNYVYQNEVYDVSATYTNGGSIGLIQGHTLIPSWGGRKNFGSAWVELEYSGARQIMMTQLDSYWQTGPKLEAGVSYGRGSEVSASYTWLYLGYDTREQSDLAGAPLADTTLALQIHALECAWTHVWDQERHWQSTTRLGHEVNLDNGSGYYDYTLFRLQERMRYRRATWEASLQVGAGFYDYAHQTVSTTDDSPRQRVLINVSVRLEKELSKHWKVHASYSCDRSISDMEFDRYLANSVLAGLALEF